MPYLISIGIAALLLAGFVLGTQYERRYATRLFGHTRSDLDARVERALFVFAHVDLIAFIREETRRTLTILGHAIAHLSLQLVRAIERLLTRAVRYLRTQHTEPQAARETKRPFVKTLSEFKDTLRTSAPDPEQFDIS